MIFILNVLIFILPLWIVNSCLNLLYPLKKAYGILSRLDMPIDMHAHFWDRRRIIGDSATILGIFVGILSSLFLSLIIPLNWYTVFLGAYGGHVLGSFIKRRMGKEDGEYVFLIDHGDAVIFTAFLYYIQNDFSIPVLIIGVVVTLTAYPVLCKIAYILKLRKYPR